MDSDNIPQEDPPEILLEAPAPPNLAPHYRELEQIRSRINKDPVLDYSYNLDKTAEAEGIKLAAVDPAELAAEEDLLEQERASALHSMAQQYQQYHLDLLSTEQSARFGLQKEYNEKKRKVRNLEDIAAHDYQQRQSLISKVFRKKEMQLKYTIKKNQGDLKIKIADNEGAKLIYGGGERIYKVNWKGRPQPVEVHIAQCKDVKDKLLRGEYVVRVIVKDRVGGRVISYTYADDEIQNNVTEARVHDGRYQTKVLNFECTLIVLAPSELEITPTMVLCFQVLDFVGSVVAEGYFPLINNLFTISKGKFKVPLVRGSIRDTVDKFSDVERLYRSNIDEWLGNLYFHVHKQKQLLGGEKDVELHLMNIGEYKEEHEYPGLKYREYEEIVTPEQYSEHKYSVFQSGILTTPKKKFGYLKAEILIELGLHSFAHTAIYWLLLLFVVLGWVGRYVHYSGQWLFLKAVGIPVTHFQATYFTLDVEYPNSITLIEEVGAVLAGAVFSLSWFLILSLIALFAASLNGKFPEFGYRVIQIWGLIVSFDPLVTLLECGLQGFLDGDWDGDSFRLYNYFDQRNGNGIIGVFMSFFLSVGAIGFSFFLFYNYFLYVHMNGRLLDIYSRVNGTAEKFFTPHDGEVSERYLQWVCYKARTYRSTGGDSRLVTVNSYLLEDEYDPGLCRTALHIVIYNVSNDSSRVLYRHFLRVTNGAICELSHIDNSSIKLSLSGALRKLSK